MEVQNETKDNPYFEILDIKIHICSIFLSIEVIITLQFHRNWPSFFVKYTEYLAYHLSRIQPRFKTNLSLSPPKWVPMNQSRGFLHVSTKVQN